MRLDAQSRLEDEGVRMRNWSVGNHRTLCPKCSHLRRKGRKDPCLSVTVQRDGCIVFYCHHCEWSGAFGRNSDRLLGKKRTDWSPPKPPPPAKPKRPPIHRPERMCEAGQKLFADRGITRPTLVALRVFQITRSWMPGLEGPVPVIVFPYFVNGRVVNHKYRAIERKAFIQDPGTRRTLYNIDAANGADEVAIVEGEMDVLAMHEAGVRAAVSLPDGASKSANDRRIAALMDSGLPARDVRFVIAGDTDDPGMALRRSLIDALGADRCRSVVWPVDPYGGGEQCKDAGDCLKHHGPAAVAEAVASAKSAS